MITIKLYGALRKFGKRFDLAAKTPALGIRALCSRLPGFEAYLRDHSTPGFHVLVGERDLGEDQLTLSVGRKVVRLVPAVAGSNAGLRIIVGVALIALSFTPYGAGWSAQIGWSLVVGGVAEMLTKPPSFNPSALDKGPADTPSYAFQGPHMTTGQGNCVPLGYGRCRVGGALISVGISPETWTAKGFGGLAPDEAGTRGGNGSSAAWVWAVAPN